MEAYPVTLESTERLWITYPCGPEETEPQTEEWAIETDGPARRLAVPKTCSALKEAIRLDLVSEYDDTANRAKAARVLIRSPYGEYLRPQRCPETGDLLWWYPSAEELELRHGRRLYSFASILHAVNFIEGVIQEGGGEGEGGEGEPESGEEPETDAEGSGFAVVVGSSPGSTDGAGLVWD